MSSRPIAQCFDPSWVEHELAIRGWGLSEFSERARLSHNTASNVRQGYRVSVATVAKVAATFNAYPPDPALASVAEGLK